MHCTVDELGVPGIHHLFSMLMHMWLVMVPAHGLYVVARYDLFERLWICPSLYHCWSNPFMLGEEGGNIVALDRGRGRMEQVVAADIRLM